MENCKLCKSNNCFTVDENEGTVVCTNCGLVKANKIIDETAEWRNFEDNEGVDPRRVGLPNNNLLSDKGLGTVISSSSLKKWNQRSQTSSQDSALIKTYLEIEAVCSSLSLPSSIIEKSAQLFKVVYCKKLTRGKSHMGIVCACIFISCRKLRNLCPVTDIATECSVDKLKLYKAYMLVKNYVSEVFPLTTAQILAKEIGQTVGLDDKELRETEGLVEEIEGFKKYSDYDNKLVAALAVFMIYSLRYFKKSLNDFTQALGVSEESFCKLYREVFPYRFSLMANLGTAWQIANLPNL